MPAAAAGKKPMDRKVYLSILAALATGALAWILFLFVAPFAEPLAWALIIGIATHPHYERIARRFPEHPDRSAGLMVLIVTLCIILPTTALIFSLARNAADLYYQGQQLFESVSSTGTSALRRLPLADRVIDLADRFGFDLAGHAAQAASAASGFLLNAATGAVKNVAQFILTLVMSIFVLYFVYRDGERVIDAGVSRFASTPARARHYLSGIRATTNAVVVGTILTCIVQGAIAGIGYFFAGLPAPILAAILTAIGALVPVVGTALVWVPLVAFLAITGAYLKAGLLAGWCIIFVGISDNAIRPLTIGARSNIPTLAVVLGAVGGASMLGLLGLLVGPILFAVIVTFWRDLTAETGGEGTDPAIPPPS